MAAAEEDNIVEDNITIDDVYEIYENYLQSDATSAFEKAEVREKLLKLAKVDQRLQAKYGLISVVDNEGRPVSVATYRQRLQGLGRSNKLKFSHRSVKLFESPLKSKKYRAIFYLDGEPFHHADFGGKGYRDFTLINDPKSQFYLPDKKERLDVRRRYIKRHSRMDEDLDDPFSAGSLSYHVLWNKPTLRKSWEDYKDRFSFG